MLSRLPRLLPRWALLAIVAAGSWSLHAAPRAEFSAADVAVINEKWPEARANPSGLRFVVLTEGKGDRPKLRQRLTVLYRGTLIDGTEFSAGLDANDPFIFRLGAGEVIVGWEEAFADMRPGEKRVLIVPYSLGYGLRGNPPNIPNRATLIFEVELLKIE